MGNTAMVTQNPSKRGFLRPSVSLFLVFLMVSPPYILPQIRTQPVECQQYCTNLKEKVFIAEDLSLVIRLGLEPKTPTLKVLCSTC